MKGFYSTRWEINLPLWKYFLLKEQLCCFSDIPLQFIHIILSTLLYTVIGWKIILAEIFCIFTIISNKYQQKDLIKTEFYCLYKSGHIQPLMTTIVMFLSPSYLPQLFVSAGTILFPRGVLKNMFCRHIVAYIA